MRRPVSVPLVTPVVTMALLAALPGALGGCHKQAAPAPQATPAGPAAPPAASQVDTAAAGSAAPDNAVEGPGGATLKLADLKGKPLLVNLWATWCAPCVKELPTLDALARREGDRLQVVAISQDMEGRRVVDPFWAGKGFTAIKPYLDTDNGLMLALKEAGLPVTILYGADGRELWRVHGDLDWSGPKAKELLAQAGA